MTKTEMKKILEDSGFNSETATEVAENYDIEKISEIVEKSHNPDEAFKALHDFYPEFDVAALKDEMNFVQEQMEASLKEENNGQPVALKEEELEMVSGGGFGSWLENHWKSVVIGLAVGAACALTCGAGAAVFTGVLAVKTASLAVTATVLVGAGTEAAAVTAASAAAAVTGAGVLSSMGIGFAAGAGIGAAIGAGAGVIHNAVTTNN